ncbi:LCP family protein [Virgibacillus ndiopensis]|uniref:LCP family glycopolymer transferase n=1 Tax=Virgibacillus ndiopensis TaxID=2004408 RepID=UPI00159BA5DB|nr:LCP family protein [Virgibacillus ndiopensis]
MDNKFQKELFSYMEEEDLTFNKEDRIETLKEIQENNNKKQYKNITIFSIGKRYIGPILGTVMVMFLAIGLFIPNLFSGNEISQENPNKQRAASQQDDFSFSALIIGENSSDNSNHRSNITMLLTYNKNDNSMKLVPIPRDAYVEIFNSEGKMIGKDKLMNASALNSTHIPVLKTVSNLFDISIDYYSVIREEDIYTGLGINKDDIKVNSTQLNELGDLIEERLSFSQIKNLIEESETTNIPKDIFNQFQMKDSNSESIQVINMEKGIEETFINGIYYVQINQNLLEKTSNTLKQHLRDK